MAFSKKNEFSARDTQLAACHAALAHPARIAILRLLASRECLCGEVVESLPLAQSTVSEHLKVLKAADLICGEVEGPKCCYGLNQKALRRFSGLFRDLLRDMPELGRGKKKKCKKC